MSLVIERERNTIEKSKLLCTTKSESFHQILLIQMLCFLITGSCILSLDSEKQVVYVYFGFGVGRFYRGGQLLQKMKYM